MADIKDIMDDVQSDDVYYEEKEKESSFIILSFAV